MSGVNKPLSLLKLPMPLWNSSVLPLVLLSRPLLPMTRSPLPVPGPSPHTTISMPPPRQPIINTSLTVSPRTPTKSMRVRASQPDTSTPYTPSQPSSYFPQRPQTLRHSSSLEVPEIRCLKFNISRLLAVHITWYEVWIRFIQDNQNPTSLSGNGNWDWQKKKDSTILKTGPIQGVRLCLKKKIEPSLTGSDVHTYLLRYACTESRKKKLDKDSGSPEVEKNKSA